MIGNGHAQTTIRGMVVVFLVVAFGVAAFGHLNYRIDAARIERSKSEDLSAIAALKIQQIVDWRREARSDVERSTRSPYFRAAVAEWLAQSDESHLRATLVERLIVETRVDRYTDVL